MTTAVSTDRLRDLISEALDDLIAVRHDLHAHPELGYEEHRTSEKVRGELDALGIKYVADMARGTGVLAHLPGDSDRATMLRADMDALPIEEATGVDYSSTTPGVMHACGHDGHTTILLGAARVLARLASDGGLPRPVTFVFQPAEEGGAGAKLMVEQGALDGSRIGPPVDHAFGLHGWPRLPLGMLATRDGVLLAAADKFEITIDGEGCHAAWPHVGRDAIVAAAEVVSALQTICPRSVSPMESCVLSVTQIHAGNAFNVMPSTVHMAGTVRTLSEPVRELIVERMQQVITHVAQAHRCTGELNFIIGYPATHNDPQAADIFRSVAPDVVGADHVHDFDKPVMGGEDFSFYGQAVPACFFALGLIPPGEESMPDLHQPGFNFNDDAIAIGVETFCRLALRE